MSIQLQPYYLTLCSTLFSLTQRLVHFQTDQWDCSNYTPVMERSELASVTGDCKAQQRKSPGGKMWWKRWAAALEVGALLWSRSSGQIRRVWGVIVSVKSQREFWGRTVCWKLNNSGFWWFLINHEVSRCPIFNHHLATGHKQTTPNRWGWLALWTLVSASAWNSLQSTQCDRDSRQAHNSVLSTLIVSGVMCLG